MWTAICDYHGHGEDELRLVKGDVIEVLRKDEKISGDEGWRTGKCRGKVGVFPSNFVAPRHHEFSNLSKDKLEAEDKLGSHPPHISWNELKLNGDWCWRFWKSLSWLLSQPGSGSEGCQKGPR